MNNDYDYWFRCLLFFSYKIRKRGVMKHRNEHETKSEVSQGRIIIIFLRVFVRSKQQ